MKTKFSKKSISKKNIGILLLIAVIGVILIVNIGGKPKEQAPLAEKPKECIKLPSSGKRTYKVMRDKSKNLEIVEVQIDPIDVKEGEMQTITVKVKDDGSNTITREDGIQAKIRTDNKNTAAAAFILKSTENSQDGSSFFSIWEGSWIRNDSNCYTYMETITVTNDKGDEDSIDLAFK